MKKLLLIPVLFGTMAMATDYNYEVTPLVGYNIAEGNLNLENKVLTGLEMQFNDVDCAIKPELLLLHSGGVKSEETTPTNSTNVTRVGLNGVYEISNSDAFSTFAKAGVGYETMSRAVADNTDGAFVDAGAGVKVPFTKELALKLEALYMLKKNSHTSGHAMGDSNLAVLAGLNYSFGEKAQKPAPVSEPAPVTEPEPVAEPEPVKQVDGDDDNDGVLNSVDECPSSPANAVVNNIGCPVIVNLHVKFEFDSFKVDSASDKNIQEFADFLNMYNNYGAKIVGHTDNMGPESYNQTLSQRRAKAVADMLIEKGVSADKISSHGMGESSPMVENSSRSNRAQNRRIEAELIKK